MNVCLRCGHEWIPKNNRINICPKCKTKYWNIAKKIIKKDINNIQSTLMKSYKLPLIFSLILWYHNDKIPIVQEQLAKDMRTSQPNISLYIKKLNELGLLENSQPKLNSLVEYFIDFLKSYQKKNKIKKVHVKSLNWIQRMPQKNKKMLEKLIGKKFKNTEMVLNVDNKLKLFFAKDLKGFFMSYYLQYQEQKYELTFNEIFERYMIHYEYAFEKIWEDASHHYYQTGERFDLNKGNRRSFFDFYLYIKGLMKRNTLLKNPDLLRQELDPFNYKGKNIISHLP